MDNPLSINDKLTISPTKGWRNHFITRTTNVVRNAGCTRSRYTLNLPLIFFNQWINELMNELMNELTEYI